MKKQKISFFHMLLIYNSITYVPAMIIIPKYASKIAKEAGWLEGILPFFIITGVLIMMNDFYKKHKGILFTEIICIILGKKTGKFIVLLYGIWSFITLCMYLRFFAEEIVLTIMKGTNIAVILFIILVITAFTSRNGIIPVIRMNIYFIYYLIITYFIMLFFNIPSININNLYPVSFNDILPAIKAGTASLCVRILIIPLFFLDRYISDKENIKKHGLRHNLFLSFSSLAITVSIIGTFGHFLASRLPLSILALGKQISLVNVIEKIEAFIVTNLFLSYYILIIVYIFIIIEIIKYLFELKETKNIVNPILVLVYFTSLLLVSNYLELEILLKNIFIPITILIYLGLTLIIYAIGKIRKVI